MKINVAPGAPLTEAELLLGGEAVDGLTGDLASGEGVGGVTKLGAFQTGLDGTAVHSEGERVQVDALAPLVGNLDPHRQPVDRGRIAQFCWEGHDLAEMCGVHRQVKIAVRPGLVAQERIYRPAATDTCPQPACSESGQQIGGCFGVHDVNARTVGRAASRRPSDP